MKNPLSFSSIKLDLFSKNEDLLKPASGFIVEAGNRYYLITNWHVLSGRDFSARGKPEPEARPFMLRTSLHLYGGDGENPFPLTWGMWKKITIPLYDDSGAPIWMERQANENHLPETDIVALPIRLNEALRFNQILTRFIGESEGSNAKYWTRISAIPLSAVDTDVDYGPPDPVYTIGYPLGWPPAGTSQFRGGFWQTSAIASETIETDTAQESKFFISPCPLDGMTGSPVVGMKSERIKLLGVYSDRATPELAVIAGLVWDARPIKDLIDVP